MVTTLFFTVRGRVQGVGFRYSARRAAQSLGVFGWIRNCENGDVEGGLQGGRDAVEAMVRWLESGPPSARVAGVDVSTPKTIEQDFSDFQIIR